ncbi:MAG: MFS transporter [Chlorogloeopsis fritschii C42_A2020_084]|uniref:MFS transporter n=1 Tax=Chlorogloeopsis fritschii TaxID=1124 RepID=UPI0019ED4E65|nr:MFS transporter [Chlorogloeopsis fritschii]MBF2009005.1 MFS transporter [Chlorogloeopsis fritschii C42_A2020_084]
MMRPLKALKAKFDLPLKFWIIALIAFINSVSFTIIIPILYPYAKQFGLSDFQASLLTTGYAIAQFIATPILGRFSDLMGRKPLLVISLIGTVAANLLASFAPVAWLLFAARIFDGLTGGNTSIARAIITDTTAPSDRAKAFGLLDAAFRLGFVTGPAISYFAQLLPTLPGVSSLGMSFFAGAIIAFLAVVLTWLLLPETLPQRQKLQLSWQMFGFSKIFQSALHPKLGKAFVLTFFSGFTFTIFTFAFQPFFLNILNQDAQTLAIIFTLIGVVGVLTQIFAVEALTKQFNLANILAVAIAGRAAVFLLIPVFPVLPAFVILACLLGITNSFPIPLIGAILSLNSSDREQGEVQGINASYLSISNAIGPAVAGLLVSISYSAPFWVTGVLTLLTAGFALSLKSSVNCGRKEGLGARD